MPVSMAICGSSGGSVPGPTLGDAVPQTPWDLSLSCQARSDAVDEKNCGMTVPIPLGSGIGTKAKNPGGSGGRAPRYASAG
jgi:hypothetical protein